MTDFDPNSPANLRALILYDISQWKTMRESIENHRVLCKHLGKKAILYDEYELCFNRCLNENYHSAIEKRDLPIPEIRAHVIYDAHQRISTETSYENYAKLCEAMRKQPISYKDYKHWFITYIKKTGRREKSSEWELYNVSSFSDVPDIRVCIFSDVINGKSAGKSFNDLCDAFKYQKIDKEDHDYWFNRFENGHLFSQVTFSDLPEDVLAGIVEKCDLNSYLNLRNVSYGIRTIVDQQPPSCTDIEVHCVDSTLIVSSDGECLNLPLKQEPRVLAFLLTNAKLRLKSLKCYSLYQDTSMYTNRFNSLNHKIHVESCSINVDYEKELMDILQCFKPGTLETLEMRTIDPREWMHEIVEMDQWKQAKHLKLNNLILPSIENFFHFSTFEATFHPISVEDVVKLCDNASRSLNFESCILHPVDEGLDAETAKRVLNLQKTTSPLIFSISNTNLFFELAINSVYQLSYKIYKK